MEPVRIELNEEDVQGKSDSEKLGILVKIAFANHKTLVEQGLALFGNGDPKKGVCYKVAFQGSMLNWVLGIFSGVSVIVIGILVKHVMG